MIVITSKWNWKNLLVETIFKNSRMNKKLKCSLGESWACAEDLSRPRKVYASLLRSPWESRPSHTEQRFEGAKPNYSARARASGGSYECLGSGEYWENPCLCDRTQVYGLRRFDLESVYAVFDVGSHGFVSRYACRVGRSARHHRVSAVEHRSRGVSWSHYFNHLSRKSRLQFESHHRNSGKVARSSNYDGKFAHCQSTFARFHGIGTWG